MPTSKRADEKEICLCVALPFGVFSRTSHDPGDLKELAVENGVLRRLEEP